MLTLPIIEKWFNMIDRGIKLHEYRDQTPYYDSRFKKHEGELLEIRLRNGYSSSSPVMQITAFIRRGTGNPEWGAAEGKVYWVLEIRDHRRVLPETFIIKARRCKRCGGLLTSAQAVADGYGHVCKLRAAQDKANAEFEKLQIGMFDNIEQ